MSIASLIIILNLVYFFVRPTRDWLDDISIILAIPSFFMSFIVLNSFSITPEELEKYHQNKKLDEAERDIIKKEYIEYLSNTPLKKIQQAEDDMRTYILKKKRKEETNLQLINKCKRNVENFQDFFDKTKDEIVYGVISIGVNKSEMFYKENTNFSSNRLNKNELEELGEKLENLSESMFTNDELCNSDICLLENLFKKDKGLFSNFFKMNKAYIKKENISINEEGDLFE